MERTEEDNAVGADKEFTNRGYKQTFLENCTTRDGIFLTLPTAILAARKRPFSNSCELRSGAKEALALLVRMPSGEDWFAVSDFHTFFAANDKNCRTGAD